MEKQISIIIPTYNMEAYIGKCLDSLLIPEFDQVEVLVVNDGSKDRSSEIAHSYANRYPNSIRVIDKPNGNYGSCINAALPLCTGRYVKVLDADDTFGTAAFSEFVKILPKLSDEALVTPFKTVNEYGNIKTITRFDGVENIQMNHAYSFDEVFNKKLLKTMYMHAVAYNRDIFSRIGYHQTEGISFTDTQWATIPFVEAKTIKFIDINPIYIYLLGREGQTMDPSCFNRQVNHYIIIFTNRIKHLRSLQEDSSQQLFLYNLILRSIYFVYNHAIRLGSKESINSLAKFDKQIECDYPKLYSDIGMVRYHSISKFCLITRWRKLGYPQRVNIPFLSRVKISFAIKLLKRFE